MDGRNKSGHDVMGPPEAAANGAASIYRAVCESMISVVMPIGDGGPVETFNPAASALLGLDREAVLAPIPRGCRRRSADRR